jgi:subtilisin family serine protease
MARRRSVAVTGLFLAVLMASCTDAEPPTSPAVPVAAASSSDERTVSEDFAFLPPIVEAGPGTSFDNDPDFLEHLSVEVCAWTGSACESPLVVRLTAGKAPGQGGIRVETDEEPGHFIANWHLRRSSVSPSTTYRVRVLAGTVELGHADVIVVANRRAASRYDGTGRIAVVQNQTLPIKFRVRQDRIEGDPGAPAGTELPEQRFVPNPDDYTGDHPSLAGIPISRNTIVVAFEASTTLAEANAVLDRIDGWVVGTVPSPDASLPGILIVQLPTADHEELIEVLDDLEQDDFVRAAVQDVLLGTTVMTDSRNAPPGWRWTVEPEGGNWGFERMRVPQMWNLNPGIRKASGGDPPGAVAGVVDVGFSDPGEHEDLVYDEVLAPDVRADHGTHVAGTIGAIHGNELGVDGLNPWARLVVGAPEWHDFALDYYGLAASWASDMLQGYRSLVQERPEVRVVNMSLGFNWSQDFINPDVNAEAQEVADDAGVLFALGQAVLEAEGYDLPVLTVSAGNDIGKDARYNSPMANAGLVQGDRNIIVVEALNQDEELALFSNIGGHVSAPGVGILSTVLPSDYEQKEGTSMAAPHVAGLVSYLYTLDSGLPRPTRADNPVLDLILTNADDDVVDPDLAYSPSPLVDAFATVMDVDRLQGGDRVLRMLLDIDDGTVDGNRRSEVGEITGIAQDDVDGDGGPGDGIIDMSDFRRWRDWLLDTDDSYHADLDRGPDHPKRDGNGDGRPGTEFEARFSRGDFNGDGRITDGFGFFDHRAHVPGVLGGEFVTDLMVLQTLFDDTNYSAEALEDLIFSADLEIDATDCYAVAPAGGRVSTAVTGSGSDENSDEGFGWFQLRPHRSTAPVELFTGRVARSPDPTTVTATTRVFDSSDTLVASAEKEFHMRPGSDRSWVPQCSIILPPG